MMHYERYLFFSSILSILTIPLCSLSVTDTGVNLSFRNKDCIIVGGGPVGLATALTLSNEPHCMNVIVLEKSSGIGAVNKYDPSRSYLYNVNSRGLQWFNLDEQDQQLSAYSCKKKALELLKERGTFGLGLRIAVVPGDPNKPIPLENPVSVTSAASYWIPRHEMVELLCECCNEQELVRRRNNQLFEDNAIGTSNIMPSPIVGSVEVLFGKSVESIDCTSLDSSECNDCVYIKCRDGSQYKASLVVGADGIDSIVRRCLATEGNSWLHTQAKAFRVKKYKSPSTGLTLKALQIPPNFTLTNTDGTIIHSQSSMMYFMRSIYNGPRTYVSLGLLPMKDTNMIRPANVITRCNHVLWTFKTGIECKEWFKKAFPRLPFDEWFDYQEWERFVNAKGTTFPYCQYSPGSTVVSPNGGAGVVLIGDACHAFPPDIGQGINAGFQDVVALDRALCGFDIRTGKVASSSISRHQRTWNESLIEYQNNRKGEHAALIRFARFGAPYQYQQPWIRDRIGSTLWTVHFVLRLLLNKVSFGRIPGTSMQLLFKNPDWSYRQIMRYADATTLVLKSIFLLPFTWWIIKKMFQLGLLSKFQHQ